MGERGPAGIRVGAKKDVDGKVEAMVQTNGVKGGGVHADKDMVEGEGGP